MFLGFSNGVHETSWKVEEKSSVLRVVGDSWVQTPWYSHLPYFPMHHAVAFGK
jgi:hypothetical protein